MGVGNIQRKHSELNETTVKDSRGKNFVKHIVTVLVVSEPHVFVTKNFISQESLYCKTVLVTGPI